MFNKDLRPIDTTVFLNKLSVLLKRLNLQYRDGTFQTQEDIVEEFRKALGEFYENASTPFLKLRPARLGTSPSYIEYNKSFEELGWDLDIAFKELATLEGVVLKNFNYTLSEKDKLNRLVKRINSKVGDYVLYSEDPIGDTIYFKDSFNDVSKIDFGTELLSEKQCNIDVAEGIVTLPVIRSDTPTSKTMKVQINENSGPNGSIGNYQEIGAAPHDDIRDILDNNPDTWFEYERVQRDKSENTNSLVLDITLYFNEPQVINFIRINPNNFGIQTSVEIDQIDTSFNGNLWVSVKDDVPISGYLQEDEEDIFTLAPSTSKYAGQGLYTFTPRKVKYIHFVFRQNTPYPISTPSGERWRYAIGIRDIEVKAIPYEGKGDVISTPFSSPVEIKKVSVLASENPTEVSELADISHQISVDDGATWFDIQPQDRSSTSIPEILNFNTGGEGAINTPAAVFSLRHRMLLSRDSDRFKEGSSTLSAIVEGGSDVLGLPSASPIKLSLTRPPVNGTVRLMNPLWGSRALDGLTIVESLGERWETRQPTIHAIGHSTGQPNQEFKEMLSQEVGSGDVNIWEGLAAANNEVVIWVDNDPTWARVGAFSGTNNQYMITNNGTVIFGDNIDGNIPSAGALIGFTLKEERLAPSGSSPYACDLVLTTDGDKQNVKIYRVDVPIVVGDPQAITGPAPVSIRPGAKIIRVPHKNLLPGDPTPETTLSFTGTTPTGSAIATTDVFTTYVEFQDGTNEFSGGGGEFSVDWFNGIIYIEDGVPADADDWVLGYTYTPWTLLSDDDWDFIMSADRAYNRISIKDTGYAEIEVSGATFTSDVRVVQFVDGDDVEVKSIVPGSIVFDGDPFDSSPDPAPYEVPFIDGETEFKREDTEIVIDGYYSVDYRNAILYVAPGNLTAKGVTVSFKYTHFLACYNIGKFMSEDSYSVDTNTQVVSVSEREILKLWGDREADVSNKRLIKAIYDYVQTTRESIEELEPYFTPIVRDYVLRVLGGN